MMQQYLKRRCVQGSCGLEHGVNGMNGVSNASALIDGKNKNMEYNCQKRLNIRDISGLKMEK